MKTILLLSIISIGVFARLNPFEPVVKPQITPITKVPVQSVDDGDRTVKIVSGETTNTQNTKPKVIVKTKIVEKKLTKQELKTQCVNLEKDLLKEKAKAKAKKLAAQKAKELELIKNFKPHTYKMLPFLTIKSELKSVTIKTRPKYKFIRYFLLENEKKFVFDFKATVETSTKHKNFNAPYFGGYTIGNHKKDNFFRVVISVKKDTKHFKVKVTNNIPVILYTK